METQKKPLELYIHIPFCLQKCLYCDFLSAPSSKAERQEYVGNLCRQIRACGELAKTHRLVSIFVGGGTPSILEAEQILEIFDAVRSTFAVERQAETANAKTSDAEIPDGETAGAEITIEMNPGTVTEEKLKAYRRAGINRLSIGLQSAENEELKRLGRIHTYEEFLDTYRLAREMGFRNINIDLISAIPGQTETGWEKTLRKVAGLRPEHISAYSLIIEEETPFYDKYGSGRTSAGSMDAAETAEKSPDKAQFSDKEKLPDEEDERRMYRNTKRILEEYGYQRYEISNYALPGYECRHNLGYWNRTEYLGIGAGAASLFDNRRWKNAPEILNRGEIPKILSPEEAPEILSLKDQQEEYMFLGLRKTEGVSKTKFEQEFGCRMEQVYGDVLRKMREGGLMEDAGDFVRLTERGIDVSNAVMCEFLL